jgi:hypothetical protein
MSRAQRERRPATGVMQAAGRRKRPAETVNAKLK